MNTVKYKSSPCVGSGLCCKTGPCGYGLWNKEKSQCDYLEVSYSDKEVEIHKCGKYEFISKQPGADMMPAFGAGCCMGLFNTARNKIITLYKSGDKGVVTALKDFL